MSVRFVLGRAGSGKSHYIFAEIEKSLKEGYPGSLILVVPEQFTLQAERDVIDYLGVPGTMQLEVLSISRLASRVFNQAGGRTRTLINELGRGMVLRKIIDENRDHLGIYRTIARQPGFVRKFAELLSELKQNDIQPQHLATVLEETEADSPLQHKIKDISLIWGEFNRYLEGKYLDSDDYIRLLVERMPQADFLKKTRIWIDNYVTFSPQTILVIEQLMLLAEQLTITLTVDPLRGRDRGLFELSRHTLEKIRDLVNKHHLPDETIALSSPAVKAAGWREPLAHLERELYAFPFRTWQEECPGIFLHAAANQVEEVERAAGSLVALARDQGYRWKDMAVVCQDMDNYGPIIARVFPQYRIPFFMDHTRDISNNPVIQFILASLEVLARRFRYEDVCRCWKSGLSPLTLGEAEILENYVLAWGIRGEDWKNDFIRGAEEDLEELNALRLKFVTPLLKLQEGLRRADNFAGYTRALFAYLEELQIADQLAAEIDAMAGRQDYERVYENTQIWNIVMETLDQLYHILGDQQGSIQEYQKVLEAGFLSFELKIIPTTVDQVLVGSVQRSKSHEIKALFVLGVNDGVLPANREKEGVLSIDELDWLHGRGLEIGLSRELRSLQESFLIYNILSKSREYLWLSFAAADGEGKALRPSLLFNRIRQIFPNLVVNSHLESAGGTKELDLVSTPLSTYQYLVRNLRQYVDGRDMEDLWWDVYRWYSQQPDWQESTHYTLQALFHRNQVGNIGPDYSKRLYPTPFKASVSRLQQFVLCPFAHLVRYGLGPRERKVFAVEAPDIGELFHNVLLAFAGQLEKRGMSWPDLDRQTCTQLVDEVMDELVPSSGGGVFASTFRYRYLVNRLKRVSRRSVWTLTQHLTRGDFKPHGHEVSFGGGGDLPPLVVELANGQVMYLEGRIDRIDLLEESGQTYVKVMDYKSGVQPFSLSDVYHGLALQLLIYMKAVLAGTNPNQNPWKPGGAFYFRIDDPMISCDERVVEEVESRLFKEFRMKGLALKDMRVVSAMDSHIEGSSEILPLGVTKQGDFSRTSSVLSEEEFQALIEHVDALLRKIATEILAGSSRIAPVKADKMTACQYCRYREICQFDQVFPDNRYREIRHLKDEEVIQAITGTAGEVRE